MKSELETKFDAVADEYFAKFGENYPLIITSQQPLSWHIQIMQAAIKSGRPCEAEPFPDEAIV